ncbi:glutamine synthetase [Elusimicrobium posterum]|uniref:glutamine synthetase family protein n=1 Tax=Elusimicrobium posterum TaxID=3116653 RepID=UPI003C746121
MAITRTAAEKKKIKEILRIAEEHNIQFIKIWFVDILGNLKSLSISYREFEHALMEGMGFDGSSVEGFARVFESDLVAVPDLDTFTILPEEFMGMPVARFFCDIKTPDGKQFEGDTRYILKKNLAEMQKMGFTDLFLGPELEFFYFKNNKSVEPLDDGGYFDTIPIDEAHATRRKTMIMLEKLGIRVEYAHHEVAPSQHEIDLKYTEALRMADNVITYKAVVKRVAAANGCYATFMPKPIQCENGSGMHVHQSLWKNGRNMFFDPKDPYLLSTTAKQYIAGVMANVKDIVSVTNQWVNSYKRLVPGYEAPAYIAWGRKNRSTLVRIPLVKTGSEKATRIECRFPDPACNPYLAFSVMLGAGLDGIKRKLKLVDPVEDNIFDMTPEEREARKIDVLPGYLSSATRNTKSSELVKHVLGKHTFDKFIVNKEIEWDQFRLHVSSYELDRYLSML